MNPKARLRKTADKLWYLKLIQDKCELCDNYAIQVHHFYYKSSYGHLRYDLENGISLCRGCHFVLHHQDPKKIEDKIIEKRGKKWYNSIKDRAYKNPPSSYLTIQYYKNIIDNL